jgi:hypothetical protein
LDIQLFRREMRTFPSEGKLNKLPPVNILLKRAKGISSNRKELTKYEDLEHQ